METNNELREWLEREELLNGASPEGVRDALQSLSGTDRLDASAIKNLGAGGGEVYDGDPTVIIQDATHRFVTDAQTADWDAKQDPITNADSIPGGSTNRYWSNALTIAATLTGYAKAGVQSAISTADTILAAFGKLEKKIDDTISALANYVTSSRTLTINGTTQDLSANRTWTISVEDNGGSELNFLDYNPPVDTAYAETGSAVPTGTPCTTLLQQAINDAETQGKSLFIPNIGVPYVVDDEIDIPGPVDIIFGPGVKIVFNTTNKHLSLFKFSGVRYGNIKGTDTMLYGGGYIPLAAIRFDGSDSQACLISGIRATQFRYGVFSNKAECYNRVIFHNCELVSNMIAGVYLKNFPDTWVADKIVRLGDKIFTSSGSRLYLVTKGGTSGTTAPSHTSGIVAATGGTAEYEYLDAGAALDDYAQIGPISFHETICNSNGIQTWMTSATYRGVSVTDGGDLAGYQFYIKGFGNLLFSSGQCSNHADSKNLALMDISEGNSVTFGHSMSIEDQNGATYETGTLITDYTLALTDKEGAAVNITSVNGVFFDSAHCYNINCPAFLRLNYGVNDVFVGTVTATGNHTYFIDVLSGNLSGSLRCRLNYQGDYRKLSPTAWVALNKGAVTLLDSTTGGIAPTAGGRDWVFGKSQDDGTNFTIGYWGADAENPDFSSGVYTERVINGLGAVFIALECTQNSFNPTGYFFIEALDISNARLGFKTTLTRGNQTVVEKLYRYMTYELPTGTRKLRYGFINSTNITADIPTHATVSGFSIYLGYLNPAQGELTAYDRALLISKIEAAIAAGGGGATTDASALTSGTLDDARLSTNVTRNTTAQTLTNKTIDGANNTVSNLPQSAITNLSSDLAAKAPLDSPTFTGTVAGITKAMVGLGAVDNTGDSTKNAAVATLTNKRITKRIGTVVSNAGITASATSHDMYTITALAVAATFAEPTGTPTNGQDLFFEVKDNGVAQTLAWNSIFASINGLSLPTTTIAGRTLHLWFKYSTNDVKWNLVANSYSLDAKQNTLISGTNIKTVNGVSLLGSGDVSISGGSDSHSTITWASSIALDFSHADELRTLTLGGNTTFANAVNMAAGEYMEIRIIGGGSLYTFVSWPAWKWQNIPAPTDLAAGKVAVLYLRCYGTAQTDVIANYSVEL